MVIGWRRAFCTSVTRDRESKQAKLVNSDNVDGVSPTTISSSNTSISSTPTITSLRCQTATISPPSLPENPCLQLQCKTKSKISPRINTHSSTPSTFSFLRSSLRLSKTRCGICFQSVKSGGQDTAIFTAECSHIFHLSCIAAQLVKKQRNLSCAVCCSVWKELPGLTTGNHHGHKPESDEETDQRTEAVTKVEKKQYARSDLKIYNDDEPLMSPMLSGVRFSPIPESDENEHESENDEEFKGFSTDSNYTSSPSSMTTTTTTAAVNFRNVEAMLLPESAVVSTGRNSETCAIVLKVKAPPSPARNSLRAPIDLVTVLDVGSDMTSDKVQLMKRAMRMIVSSLSYTDRLSIVAFSSNSKRLLPLRRMTANGRSSARRIIDAIIACQGKSSPNDAVKKAMKVLEDRRDRNPFSSIILMSDVSIVSSSTRMEIPVHSIRLDHRQASSSSPSSSSFNDEFEKSIVDLLSVVVQDLQIQLAIQSGSAAGEISAVYSLSGRSVSHSGSMKLGDLHAEEERELLIEVKVPLSAIRSSNVLLTVRCIYKDPSTEELIYNNNDVDNVQTLLIPPPNAVQSNIQRLRSIFVSTRALAESRRLIDRNDLTGAYHMLSSAQGLLSECGGGAEEEDDLGRRGLEAAIADLQSRQQQLTAFHGRRVASTFVDEPPLTPTSAWRAAERLAKVAIMRKSMNRVGDLHGLENAGF